MAVVDPAQDLALILASISEGLAVYDSAGYMRLVNDRGRFLLALPPGLEKASLAERVVIEQVSGEDGEPITYEDLPVYRALHGETTRHRVLRFSPAGQPQRWLRFSAAPLLDADGKPCGAVSTFDDVTREHELEEQLRTTRWRYQKVFEHSLDAIFLALPDGPIEVANPAACRMLGMAEEEICRGGRDAIVEPTPEAARLAERRRQTGEARGELQFRRKDGSLVVCDTTSAAFLDERGVERAIVVARDITERKRAEQALKESEERFRQLADAMPQLVWTALPDGTLDYFNGRAGEYAGLEHRADGSWAWPPMVHPDDRQATLDQWSRSVARGEQFDVTVRLGGRDGSYRWHLVRGVPVRDASGCVVRWFGTCTDIDWQKRAEQALKESEERFRQLADAMPQLVWTARSDGTADYYNQRAAEYAGLERRADGSWSWEPALHPDDRQGTDEAWARAVERGENYEITHRLKVRGVYTWYLSRAVPGRDASGRIVRWYGTSTDIDWQKQAEQQLRESEERFRQLADAMPQLVWSALPDGTVDYYNQRYRDFPGLEPQPDGKWVWQPQLHPDDRQATVDAWARAVERGENYEVTQRIQVGEGVYRWYLTRGVPVRDSSGRVVRWYGTSTDIDWQKRAEQQLRASEERFHQLADAMPALVWTALPDGTVDYVNERAREYAGLVRRPDGSWTNEAPLHPDDARAVMDSWERAWRLGEKFEVACRLRLRDGTYRWHLNRALPARDESGRVARWYGTITDIDWQKQAEQQLRESEEQLRQLADAMPQLVWKARPDGVVDYINDRAREYEGLERRPDGFWSLEQSLHPDDAPAALEAWERAWRHGEKFEVACRLKLRDGTYRWHLNRGIPVRDDCGRVVRWYGTATDIDWQKKAELALIEADRLRDKALASIAHELRNPLSAINTAIHLLQRQTSAESAQRAAETIDRQARHLNRLVGDLLDTARVSQGKLHMEMERLELGELVRRTVEDYRPLFDQQGIELELSRCAEPLWGLGDATRLTQAVGNVLDNAAKFTPRGGRVVVTVEAEPCFAVVRIKDNGAGIPPQVLERLFHQFVQADETLERRRSGLGLGLALVKGIVELHGGRVLALSEGTGRGSEFVLRLPIEPVARTEAQPPA